MNSVANNPINTQEQRDHELLALAYVNKPEIQAVKEQVREFWLNEVKPSAEMR